VGIGVIAFARRLEISHLAAAEKVGNEFEPRAIPGEEKRTRRRFPSELLDRHLARERFWRLPRRSFSLADSRRPQYPHDVTAGAIAKTKHDAGGRHGGRR